MLALLLAVLFCEDMVLDSVFVGEEDFLVFGWENEGGGMNQGLEMRKWRKLLLEEGANQFSLEEWKKKKKPGNTRSVDLNHRPVVDIAVKCHELNKSSINI